MQYTNKHNLPISIVTAITKDRYSDPNDLPSDYSVTTVINPVQQTILRKRYKEERRVPDVMELFFSFKGAVGHQVLEDAWSDTHNTKIEERLYLDVDGKTISGKFDCFDMENGELIDYKFTKVYKYMKNDFAEWEAQLNIYAYMLRKESFNTNKITIWMFLEDYKENESYKKGYPPNPIVDIQLNIWSDLEVESYLKTRVNELARCEEVDDVFLPECSEREMWQDVRDFALIKKGATRATKCFETMLEAMQFVNSDVKYQKSDWVVEKRLTQRKRCLKHCDVSHLCQQHKQYLKSINQYVDDSQAVIF